MANFTYLRGFELQVGIDQKDYASPERQILLKFPTLVKLRFRKDSAEDKTKPLSFVYDSRLCLLDGF